MRDDDDIIPDEEVIDITLGAIILTALKAVVLAIFAIVGIMIGVADGEKTGGQTALMAVGLICLAWLYFLPTITAWNVKGRLPRQTRKLVVGGAKHPHLVWILLINLFFGATGLGWIGSMFWALNPGYVEFDRRYE